MGIFDRLFGKPKKPTNNAYNIKREVRIPAGPINVHVQAEHYRQSSLKRFPKDKEILFSLTPKNSYQAVMGWPEGEFYNVNIYPSSITTESNWLGYVSYAGKPTASQIAAIVNSGTPVSVLGFIEIEGDERNIVLTTPRSL